VVDWNAEYQDRPVHIKFQFFNWDFETNLYEFHRRLRLPHGGLWTVGHENFNVQSFCCKIMYDKRTKVHKNHGSEVAHRTNGCKATSIYNTTLWYLRCLIANTIFA